MNLSDLEFSEMRRLIQTLCGIWLGNDKKYLVRTRLEPVLVSNQLASYSELIRLASLPTNLRLQDELIEAITTNETSFYRDGHPFEEFRQRMLPELIAIRSDRQRRLGLPFGKLRIWSAAASTGQEAYSLGILILEYLQSQSRNAKQGFLAAPDNFSILATDISSQALRVAKNGVYVARDLDRGLPLELRQKYFIHHQGRFTISPMVKSMIEFQRLNLVKPFSDMNGFDAILCRNLLIYFDEPTRSKVTDQLFRCLTPEGILMLGAAESIPILPNGLVQQQIGKTVVFRKRL
jgi:chemotaxis protein methyltransferase CheR